MTGVNESKRWTNEEVGADALERREREALRDVAARPVPQPSVFEQGREHRENERDAEDKPERPAAAADNMKGHDQG